MTGSKRRLDSHELGGFGYKRQCLEVDEALPAVPPQQIQPEGPFALAFPPSTDFIPPTCSTDEGVLGSSANSWEHTSSINTDIDFCDDPEFKEMLEGLELTKLLIDPQSPGTLEPSSPGIRGDLNVCSEYEPLDGVTQGETQQPPYSVIRAFDCRSRSADVYDPQLQHLSPGELSNAEGLDINDLLLDEDVDWDFIHEHSCKTPTKLSAIDSRQTSNPNLVADKEVPESKSLGLKAATPKTSKPSNPTPAGGDLMLKPFKTFFQLSEMLEAKQQIFKNQTKVVFELFARVIYSSRENFQHKQYFQFRDLLKESPPYLNGTLSG